MTDSDPKNPPTCARPDPSDTHTEGTRKSTLSYLRAFITACTERTLESLGSGSGSRKASTTMDVTLDTENTSAPANKKHKHYRVSVAVAVSDGARPDCSCDPTVCCPCLESGVCTCSGKCRKCSICCPVCYPFPVDCIPWWRRRCTKYILGALALLVLLLLLLWLFCQCSHTGSHPAPNPAPVTVTQAEPSLPPAPPPIIRDPTVGSTATLAPPAQGALRCDGHYHDVDQIPGYALIHAWRQEDAVKWSVKCGEDMSAIVIARDANYRAQSIQVFGPNNQYEYQWALAYGPGYVQVDRYEPFMAIVGRTVFRFDQAGRISSAYRQDGHLTPLMEATLLRDAQSKVSAVVVHNDTGGATVRYTSASDIAAALSDFYLFETFNEPHN